MRSRRWRRQARKNTGGEKDRRGYEAADESCDGSPGKRAQRLDAGAFELAIERVGFDEEAEPELVERGVGDAEDEAAKNVADERTEDGGGVVGGPIEFISRDPRKNCKMREKPPENRVAETPTHAGAVAAHVALKEETEGDADENGDAEMQKDMVECGRGSAP